MSPKWKLVDYGFFKIFDELLLLALQPVSPHKGIIVVCVTDPSLESDSDLGLVGDETNGGAQHLMLAALNGISLNADHLPADLLEGQNLEPDTRHISMIKLRVTQYPDGLLNKEIN